MTFSTAALFSQNLIKFIEFYSELSELDPENLKHGELKSEVMYKDDKKYHMDMKENARGRFLKVSETFTRGYSRFQVFVPADGMKEFQHNLGELIDEYDNGTLPLSKLRIDTLKEYSRRCRGSDVWSPPDMARTAGMCGKDRGEAGEGRMPGVLCNNCETYPRMADV